MAGAGGDFQNPLRKFKLVFLGEQSGASTSYPFVTAARTHLRRDGRLLLVHIQHSFGLRVCWRLS